MNRGQYDKRRPFDRRRTRPGSFDSGWQFSWKLDDGKDWIIAVADKLRYDEATNRVTAWKVTILATGRVFQAPSLNAAEDAIKLLM